MSDRTARTASIDTSNDFLRTGAPVKPSLLERHSHPVIPLPDDAARKLQSIIRQDQREGFFDRNETDQFGKLDRSAGSGQIAYRARIFVAAILRNGWLVDLIPRSDPGFDHVE